MTRPLRLLLIEDSDDDALLVLQELRRGGFAPSYERVDTETGMAAALANSDWDLVISDFSLPQFNGMQALKLFRKQGSDIPFILVSGTIGEEIAVEAMRSGAHDYVMKQNLTRLVPAVERELAEAVQRQQRKQAEKALTHFHDLMRYIIEHNQSAVAVHDRDLKYIYVSQRYLQDYGVKECDVIGKHHYDVFPDLPQKWRDVHQKALAGEISSAEDDPYVRENGTVEWTRWECRPWYEADGSIGGIIIYTEIITERKQAEEALRVKAEELQRWQTATLGREGRVAELKTEVNELAVRLGESPPYGTRENLERKE